MRALRLSAFSARREVIEDKISFRRSGWNNVSARCVFTNVSSLAIGMDRPLKAILPFRAELFLRSPWSLFAEISSNLPMDWNENPILSTKRAKSLTDPSPDIDLQRLLKNV